MYNRNYGGFDYVRIHSELLRFVHNPKFLGIFAVTDFYTFTLPASKPNGMEKHSINNPFSVEEISYINPYDFSKMHRHNYFELMLFETVSGESENNIDFVTYPVLKHSLHIICPNQVHLFNYKTNDDGILIQFTREYLIHSLQQLNPEWLFLMQTNPMTKLTESQFNTLFSLFKEMQVLAKNNKSDFKKQLTKHLFLYTFFSVLKIIGNQPNQQKTNSTTIQFLYLAENQFKTNRTVANYVKQMRISSSKLRDNVIKALGKTPLQVLHDLTKLEIKRLLLIEKLSHKEVTFELNFDSTASYTRFVKKHFSCTPTELAKKNQ